ncbi:aminopeptidase P family protein [Patescibacteria group bacterium]|nr:aminopeptidase P family protein [Patescibacteria group bacterium]
MIDSDQKNLRVSPLKQRVSEVRERLKEKNLDAFLVSSAPNRFYLTGWHGDSESGFVLITREKNFIITDVRYTEHVSKETAGFKVIETNEGIGPTLRELFSEKNLKRIGYESHHLSVFHFKRMKRLAKEAKFVPIANLIEEIRAVKSESEIWKLARSARIASKAFDHVLNFIQPGLTEAEVAWEMEKFMKTMGAEKMAWEPLIVATGANSSMVHWGAGNNKIKKGDQVQLDYGCSSQGYQCDISRVVFVGKPNKKQAEIYNLVIEAQKLGLSLVKEGRVGGMIDLKVQKYLAKYSKYYYRHSLGHGVGLEVHELPYINTSRKSRLESGNIITIEPGIYIPRWGGVRIEDTVLVTKYGYQALTKSPSKLSEVTI